MEQAFMMIKKRILMTMLGMGLTLLTSACASGGEVSSLSAEESYKAVLLGAEDFIHVVNV